MSFYCEMHRIQILYTVPKEHANDLYTCCWSYIIWAQLQQGNFKPTGLRWHMVSFMDDRIFLSLSVKSSDFFLFIVPSLDTGFVFSLRFIFADDL